MSTRPPSESPVSIIPPNPRPQIHKTTLTHLFIKNTSSDKYAWNPGNKNKNEQKGIHLSYLIDSVSKDRISQP